MYTEHMSTAMLLFLATQNTAKDDQVPATYCLHSSLAIYICRSLQQMTTVTGACCVHSSAVTDLSFSEELYNHVNVRTEVPVLVQGAARAHTQCPDHSHTHNTC